MSCLISVYSLSLININKAAENTLYFMVIDPVFTSFIMQISCKLSVKVNLILIIRLKLCSHYCDIQDTDVLTAFISLVCVKLFNVNQNKSKNQ